ncbi:MAG: NAD(P)H-hydrate epimerase [Candidatus Thorarchaeota archaeon]
MVEVDRIMVNELKIPIELMMEQAGLSFARLAVAMAKQDSTEFIIVAGSGNNGGGGLVAARHLINWNHDVSVIIPKGNAALREVPMTQLQRLRTMGVEPEESLPLRLPDDATVLDAYIGYGYTKRVDRQTRRVFESLKHHERVISLDVPSGFDATTGMSESGIQPIATLTIAFVKTGLLLAKPHEIGDLYICDIGVPSDIYLTRLDINWSESYNASMLEELNDAFARDPLCKVQLSSSGDQRCWTL